ncbi:hypothetical protein LJC10_06195 [Selenomonadales bacterium OttesenSCG-928-I06]|nr:hypothetical protein [Selenomonadales bacterium OttesenSCG-928-I06]
MSFSYEGVFYVLDLLGNKVEALEKILDYREQEVEELQEENDILRQKLTASEYRDVDDLARENEELRRRLLEAEEEIGCAEALLLSSLGG